MLTLVLGVGMGIGVACGGTVWLWWNLIRDSRRHRAETVLRAMYALHGAPHTATEALQRYHTFLHRRASLWRIERPRTS